MLGCFRFLGNLRPTRQLLEAVEAGLKDFGFSDDLCSMVLPEGKDELTLTSVARENDFLFSSVAINRITT
ncbi:hypothetical protein BgiMline_029166 [Biomphalaria glabrata]